MKDDLRRIFTTLVILVGVAVPLRAALSFTLDDLVQHNGIQNNQLYDKTCKAKRIVDLIKAVKGGYAKQIIQDTIKDFANSAMDFANQTISCKAAGFLNANAGKIGGAVAGSLSGISGPGALLIGGSITNLLKSGGAVQCVKDVGGKTSAILKRLAMDAIEKNFQARCLARQVFNQVEDDMRRIINENGPDGGPAYVTSWTDLPAVEDTRAIARFCAILVHTKICPSFRDRALAAFECPQEYINNPPWIDKNGFRVDGRDPFTLRGACSAPDDLTPETLDADFVGRGGFAALALLQRPENNFNGFVSMAEEELANQRNAVISGAYAEAESAGGFRGLYNCISDDGSTSTAGPCLAMQIVQPAGGVSNQDQALKQGEATWIATSKEMNTIMGDVRQRIISGLLDISQKPLDFPIEIDGGTQEYADLGTATPAPPMENACADVSPDCVCIAGDPQLEEARGQIASATSSAVQDHPELVAPDGSSVLPGQNQAFLTAVCEALFAGGSACHPSPTSDSDIVILNDGSVTTYGVLTNTGIIRIPGDFIAACPAGTI